MNTARYFIALLLVVMMPPALLFWFVIHPFVAFWRRLGTVPTYLVVGSLMLLIAAALAAFRQPLLAVEYGTRWPLVALAAVLAAASFWIAWQRRRHLTTRILTGVPELAPPGAAGKLLAEGIYARVRNPRYVEIMVGVAAYALFADYLAGYAIVAFTVVAVYLIVLLEERELRDRFGAEYEAYLRRVPRFLPRRSDR